MDSYVVAIFAMALSAASALSLFAAIRHVDPPETKEAAREQHVGV